MVEIQQILLRVFINSLGALLVLLFAYILNNFKMKVKPIVVLSLIGGICNTFTSSLSSNYGIYGQILNTIVSLAFWFIVFRYYLKLSIVKFIFTLIITMVVATIIDSLVYLFLTALKIDKQAVVKDYKYFLINYAIGVIVFFIFKYFKLFLGFPKEIKLKALGFYIGNIIFTAIILLVNMYYINYYEGTRLSKGLIAFESTIFCYLVFSFIFTNNNILKYKKLMDKLDMANNELNAKNQELIAINEQLRDYTRTAEELAVTKERNRFARDIHDTLGHTLTVIIKLLEVCSLSYKTDTEKTGEKIIEATNKARDGLREVRRSVSGLSSERLESNNLISALEQLIDDFKRQSDVEIHFMVNGLSDDEIRPLYSEAIYRTCQEAMTNSLRHGKATNIAIILSRDEGEISLTIMDNGKGCDNIKKGFGLNGMEQRIKGLNGSVEYGSDEGGGFNIHINIPQ